MFWQWNWIRKKMRKGGKTFLTQRRQCFWCVKLMPSQPPAERFINCWVLEWDLLRNNCNFQKRGNSHQKVQMWRRLPFALFTRCVECSRLPLWRQVWLFAFKAIRLNSREFPEVYEQKKRVARFPISHLMKSWMRAAHLMTKNYKNCDSSLETARLKFPHVNVKIIWSPDLITLLSIFETSLWDWMETWLSRLKPDEVHRVRWVWNILQ